ncbi:pyridoxamine 5'-phosphate oxidase [Pedobacter frigiditerrae]|uniref:Pyridoxine/pyridoxamine 5'-phosphate oxidase n=1 Tax=Pedobacter frigiditerrae TaxID=2530452 RepID=A0A4R0MWC8_9SPHI|nr:pyridoxamine 5'-phosphate oxidase [Pedobacter frigiditerrae]TCC90532.1 pyridoxamine 5'-phosphate oxidase [Pedobacter frigiditerrae]
MELTKEMIQSLRQDYRSAELSEKDADKNPIKQFENWFSAAIDAQLYEPNVMTLATADKSGKPNARIVLLKGFDENGFSFYTNYLSTKGKEIKKNPQACLVFFWAELERQVRIEGKIEKLSKEASEKYFHSRPVGSQIGAIVSPQSQIITDRKILENKVEELTNQYEGKTIPKPAHWGGYIVKPTSIEFWQGRTSRLHDRIKYDLINGKWQTNRLAP